MKEVVLAREVSHRVGQGHGLADHRGQGGSLDAHVQPEDEDGVKDGVGGHREKGQAHGQPGISGGPYDTVESEIKVRDDVAQQDDHHVAPCEWQGVVARSEEIQYRIEEQEGDQCEEDAYYDIERQYVGKDLLRGIIVLLPQEDGDQRHSAHAHEGAEGGGEIHQGEGYGQSRNGVRSHVPDMADVDTVDHVVQRSRGLGDDARNRVHLQKFSDFLRPEFGRGCTCPGHLPITASSQSFRCRSARGRNPGSCPGPMTGIRGPNRRCRCPSLPSSSVTGSMRNRLRNCLCRCLY